MERWLPIPGYEGLYEVSDLGRVRSARRKGCKGIVMRPRKASGNHLFVGLCRDGKYQNVLVHRLVLTVFVGPCPPMEEACHADGDPKNNALTNLRWDTRKANIADRFKHGTFPIGEKCHWAKLNEEKVRAIFSRIQKGVRIGAIAKEFQVSHSAVSMIASGKRWSHLGLAP